VTSFLLLLVAAAGLFCAALAAVYSYGRFASLGRGPASHALPLADDATAIDRFVVPLTRAHPGQTGIELISGNLEAFAVRVRTARRVQRSLDLQYYIWDEDLTGRLLLQEVLDAADRSVRVRLLLDDVNAQGRDRMLLGLDRHPNIEVRLFNPIRARQRGLRRGLELLFRAWRANRRMHNKAWIADGRVAVVGGRNIGDKYFDADGDLTFRDLDLIVIGDAVAHAEAMFDRFWNSAAVVPIASLRLRGGRLRQVRRTLARFRLRGTAQPYLERVAQDESLQALLAANGPRFWVHQTKVAFDPPEKCEGLFEDQWLRRTVGPLLLAATQRLRILSPYFIPGPRGTAALLGLVQAGVQASVLTNSLAATDVVIVHGAYAQYRKRLARGGVQLFELKPYRRRRRVALFGSSFASLHTKAFTIYGHTGFVGSMNFDPRSIALNTEMGILFTSPELVAEIDAIFAEETAPERAYRVSVENGRLTWRDQAEEGTRALRTEPAAGAWRRSVALAVRLLPIEWQL
jgi:putative cardiolipin synthase